MAWTALTAWTAWTAWTGLHGLHGLHGLDWPAWPRGRPRPPDIPPGAVQAVSGQHGPLPAGQARCDHWIMIFMSFSPCNSWLSEHCQASNDCSHCHTSSIDTARLSICARIPRDPSSLATVDPLEAPGSHACRKVVWLTKNSMPPMSTLPCLRCMSILLCLRCRYYHASDVDTTMPPKDVDATMPPMSTLPCLRCQHYHASDVDTSMVRKFWFKGGGIMGWGWSNIWRWKLV
ncbi:hypothetical protein EV426DRAFT_680402 [Tirmania nivea]|nr:hypothetical protein EV426DRAFT_680402 [Tirmania nivea]